MEAATEAKEPPRLMIVNHEARLRRLTYYGEPVKVETKPGEAPRLNPTPVHDVPLTPGVNMVDASAVARTGVVPEGASYGPLPGYYDVLSIVDFKNEALAYEVVKHVKVTASKPALRELLTHELAPSIIEAANKRLAELEKKKAS